MSKIRNLATGNLGDIAKQQHRDQYATPLNGSSVGSGGQRFYGTGKLTVENEGLYVNGTANISGTLSVTGTSTFTGTTNLNGPTNVAGAFTVTGLTKLNGDTTVGGKIDVTGAMATKGTLSVEGVTTLKSDLNVTSGGKITVGNTILSPSATNGGVEFASGGGVGGNGGTVAMRGSSNAGFLAAASASVFAGSRQFTVSGTGYNFASVPTTTLAANVYMDASGNLFRKT